MSGEGDLESTEGHSQLLVGTLPLTDKNPPEDPKDRNPLLGPASGFSEDNPGNLSRNVKLVTTPSSEKLQQVVDTSPLPQRKDSPFEYPPQDQPKAPPDSEEDLEVLPSRTSQSVPSGEPFSRFGQEKQLIHQTKAKRDLSG